MVLVYDFGFVLRKLNIRKKTYIIVTKNINELTTIFVLMLKNETILLP